MKFTKFSKALLMSALSAGVILSVTSCVQDYSVGYLYVTGTVTSDTTGKGIISGYKIDHNKGSLTAVHGLPVSSGGAYPIRAALIIGSRFLYVLNRGTTASGSPNCTTADPCNGSNITVFSVGANGILTPQGAQYYSKGINPFRMFTDTSGAHLFVLDHDASDSASYTGTTPTTANPNSCMNALGNSTTSCGDITVFTIDGTTGRLSVVENAQVTSSSGTPLAYFPVPANPVDFVMTSSSSIIETLSSSTAQTSFPYTGGNLVFPYSFSSGNAQLTISQNTPQSLEIGAGTAIDAGGSNIYVLDNEPITVNSVTSFSQILPYTVASNGALQTQTGGAVPDDPTLSNPTVLLVESKSKWIYVANEGNNTNTNNTQSGIAGYVLNSPFQLTTMAGEPFGAGAGPQCMVEDPSDQFIFTANFNDSTVTGHVITQNSGNLTSLINTTSSYTLDGPPSWCLINGRTG